MSEQNKLSDLLVLLLTWSKNQIALRSYGLLPEDPNKTYKQEIIHAVKPIYGYFENASYSDIFQIVFKAYYEALQEPRFRITGNGMQDVLCRFIQKSIVPRALLGSAGLIRNNDEIFESFVVNMISRLTVAKIDWCRGQLPDLLTTEQLEQMVSKQNDITASITK